MAKTMKLIRYILLWFVAIGSFEAGLWLIQIAPITNAFLIINGLVLILIAPIGAAALLILSRELL